MTVDTKLTTMRSSASGKRLATGDEAGHVALWAVPAGVSVTTVKAHASAVTAITFNPDGRSLVSAGADHTVAVWTLPDLESSACLLDLKVTDKEAQAISFKTTSADGIAITTTLPCGSPLPPNAVCTCNCVAGSYTPPPPPPSYGGGGGYGGGMICTCNQVCTCVPVYR
jgi:WD40 repeat protein